MTERVFLAKYHSGMSPSYEVVEPGAIGATPWVPEGSGVRVKALVWELAPDREPEFPKWTADTGFGKTYSVFKAWWGAQDKWGYVGEDGFAHTAEAAKAAAQVDYEARILSASEPVAEEETPTPGQFTTMCLSIEDVITGRGFDVEIPEQVKEYLRNTLMVAGWKGEQE